MWLSKIFGGRRSAQLDADDEPARFPNSVTPLSTPQNGGAKNGKRSTPPDPPQGTGFDPYNSGSFKRDDAWQRVKRR